MRSLQADRPASKTVLRLCHLGKDRTLGVKLPGNAPRRSQEVLHRGLLVEMPATTMAIQEVDTTSTIRVDMEGAEQPPGRSKAAAAMRAAHRGHSSSREGMVVDIRATRHGNAPRYLRLPAMTYLLLRLRTFLRHLHLLECSIRPGLLGLPCGFVVNTHRQSGDVRASCQEPAADAQKRLTLPKARQVNTE